MTAIKRFDKTKWQSKDCPQDSAVAVGYLARGFDGRFQRDANQLALRPEDGLGEQFLQRRLDTRFRYSDLRTKS